MRYNSVDGKWRDIFSPPQEEYRQPLYSADEYAASLRRFASTSLTNYYLQIKKASEAELLSSNGAAPVSNGNPSKSGKKLSSAKQWLMSNRGGASGPTEIGGPFQFGRSNGRQQDYVWSGKNLRQHVQGLHHSDLNLNMTSSTSGSGQELEQYPQQSPHGFGRFPNISELLRSLKNDLKFSFPRFVDDFVAQPHDGIGLLLDVLKQIQLSQTDCTIDCRLGAKQQHACLVRTLTDEHECLFALNLCCCKPGTDMVVARSQLAKRRDGSGLYTLAVCLMSNVNKSRILASELLCLACENANSGHEQVLEAISTLRLRFGEPIRFKFLVGMLSSFGCPDFQIGCMRLLNTLVETAGTPKERAYLQAEMEEAGLDVATIRKALTLNSPDATVLFSELERWENNYIDVGGIVGKLDYLTKENLSLKERVSMAEQRWKMMERERDALIAAEENLKSKCTDLEHRLNGLRRNGEKVSEKHQQARHYQPEQRVPANGKKEKAKILPVAEKTHRTLATGENGLPHSDDDDDDGEGSLTSLTETEYDVAAQSYAVARKTSPNSQPPPTAVNSATIVKSKLPAAEQPPLPSKTGSRIPAAGNDGKLKTKPDGVVSSDESFYAEKNGAKETITIQNETVIVKPMTGTVTSPSPDASTSSSSSSGRGTSRQQHSRSPTVVSETASSFYGGGITTEEDIIPNVIRHPPPPVPVPHRRIHRQTSSSFSFEDFEDQRNREQNPRESGNQDLNQTDDVVGNHKSSAGHSSNKAVTSNGRSANNARKPAEVAVAANRRQQSNNRDPPDHQKRLQTEEQLITEEIQRALHRGQQKHLRANKQLEEDSASMISSISSSAIESSVLSGLTAFPRHQAGVGDHRGMPPGNPGNLPGLSMTENSDTESCQSPKDPDIDSRGSVSLRTTVESESTKSFIGGYLNKPQQASAHVKRRETFDTSKFDPGSSRYPSAADPAALRRAESFQHGLALPKAPNTNKNNVNGGSSKGFWPKLFSFGDAMTSQQRPTGPSDYNAYLVYDPEMDDVAKRRDGRDRQRSGNKPASRRSSASSSRSSNRLFNQESSNSHEGIRGKYSQGELGERRARALSLSQSNLLESDSPKTDNWTIKWRYPKVGSADSTSVERIPEGPNGNAGTNGHIDQSTFVVNKDKQKKKAKAKRQQANDSPPLPPSSSAGIYLPSMKNSAMRNSPGTTAFNVMNGAAPDLIDPNSGRGQVAQPQFAREKLQRNASSSDALGKSSTNISPKSEDHRNRVASDMGKLLYYPSPAASAAAAAAAAQLAASGCYPYWFQHRRHPDGDESMRTFDIPTPDYSTMGSVRTVIHHEITAGRAARVLDMPAGLY